MANFPLDGHMLGMLTEDSQQGPWRLVGRGPPSPRREVLLGESGPRGPLQTPASFVMDSGGRSPDRPHVGQ